jgi:predicted nuclease of predicted toxin-antitoxin system
LKLLFDENLRARLVRQLADLFSGSEHVADVGLGSASDAEIWEYARGRQFAIASKDDDFEGLALVRGAPPKVILIRAGNTSTSAIRDLLMAAGARLQEFDADPTESLLVL